MSTAPTAPAAPSVPLPVGRLVGVGAIIFCANAALLVLQLVAGRLLSPYIGSSLETWTSIIGVFLGGIALGNGFGGKLADRYPTPRTLAALLALGAVAAMWMMIFPMILAATGLHKPIPLGIRIPILSALLCLPAGFVLSLLTPLAIKLGLPDVAHTGRVAGLIFALSTLGCLLGNYATGFYLIPTFTINALVVASAGALLGLAAVSLVIVKPGALIEEPTPPGPLPEGKGEKNPLRANDVSEASMSSSPLPFREGGPGGVGLTSPVADAPGSPNPHAFADIRHAYLIVFLASFCGMTLELTASRVLAQQLGVSLFTWTGIIGVMLAGTALGNFTGGQIADRPRRAAAWLTGIVAGLVLVLAALVVADRLDLPVMYALGFPPPEKTGRYIFPTSAGLWQLRIALGIGAALGIVVCAFIATRMTRRATELPPPNPRTVLAATLCAAGAATVFLLVTYALITRWSAFTTWDPITQVMGWTFSLFFLPMFMLGLVSPQVIRLAVPDVSHVGRVAGRVYAWSTVGAIVGTFAAGYVLLSTIGMYRTILAASLVLVLTSLRAAKVWDNNPLLYLFSIVLGGITGGFILKTRDQGEEGLIKQVESNYYTIKVSQPKTPPDAEPDERRLLYLDRLLHSVVNLENPRYLYYEHEEIQVEFLWQARARVQATGSVPPAARALVVGGGGYTFPRYAMEVIPDSVVDVVEIDPKVTRVAREYLGLKDYRNLKAIHMDGRQYVAERAAPGSYDLVVQDAVNDLSVPGHLMTKEYNDAIKRALKPDGVYLLTIIDSVGNGKLWKAAMATLAQTFPAENIVLLTPHTVQPAGTPDGDTWEYNRQVMVIYASDKPFKLDELTAALPGAVDAPARLAALRLALSGVPGGGAAVPAFQLNVAHNFDIIRPHAARTLLVPPERLKPFTDREPGVVLTDQFCPVDNLMAEVFRNRNK